MSSSNAACRCVTLGSSAVRNAPSTPNCLLLPSLSDSCLIREPACSSSASAQRCSKIFSGVFSSAAGGIGRASVSWKSVSRGINATRPPALLGLSAVVLVRQEVLHRGQQKPPEAAPLGPEIAYVIFFEQEREVFLSRITRLVYAVPLASNICVQGAPVEPAKRSQRFARLRSSLLSGRQHYAPASRGKSKAAGSEGRHQGAT